MERTNRTTPDPVGKGHDSQAARATRDEDDALDELISRPAEAEEAVHPFDVIPESALRDPAGPRHVSQTQRDAYWSRLVQKPWSFDFFAAVRWLEALHPALPGFASSNRSSEDPVRFCQHPSLIFAPCTVSELREPGANGAWRLFVNFMGLLGPNGPLPLHLTEHAHLRELHAKDFTFSRFLDVFNHRMVSLFYRAWAASQMPASFDRTPPAALRGDVSYAHRERLFVNEKDRYPVYIGSLFGLGMDTVRHRDAVPDLSKLFFAGRLAGNSNGPEGLRSILAHYFTVPVEIQEFDGRWLRLPSQYWTRLGQGTTSDHAAASTLGGPAGAAICGQHVWDCQGRFRIIMGPMSFPDFERFIPGCKGERRLRAWVRNYAGDEFAWEAVIVLKRQDVPMMQLGKKSTGARLGWTTWLRTAPADRDRGDLVVRGR